MSSIVKTSCEAKGGLFRCRSEAVAYCQYCGRPFCAEHTTVRDGEGKEVCSRKFCLAKWDDLQKHLVYKAAVDERNAASACGIHGCDAGIHSECVRCKGHFCMLHVQPREEPVLHNKVVINQMATLCYHCWQRRPIWVRM